MPRLNEEINRRRTFAIISHPDAGKTTLTEKLLLYGGAIQLAGSVKGKATARHAVSDWMELEKQRGISITSSVMQFEYDGYCINILDTPGHQDFSEDTYRTLMAADSAVMVIDAAKGIEPQTRKLFRICAMRHIPIFTFINKLDREARSPYDLLEELEKEFGIGTYPMNWPIGCGTDFKGVYDRQNQQILAFQEFHRGQNRISSVACRLDETEKLDELIGERLRRTLEDDVELVDGAGYDFDLEAIRAGLLSPVFFGSALNNFGVEPCSARASSAPLCAASEALRLSQPQQRMASDRSIIDEAFAGDIIGVFDPGIFSIGDTVCEKGMDIRYEGIPSFAPEHFAAVERIDTMKRKQFEKGIMQIAQEGAIQIFHEPHTGVEEILVGVVGVLQFEVLEYRLKTEYGVDIRRRDLPYELIRWVSGDNVDIPMLNLTSDTKWVQDFKGNNLLLFTSSWCVDWALQKNPGLELKAFNHND